MQDPIKRQAEKLVQELLEPNHDVPVSMDDGDGKPYDDTPVGYNELAEVIANSEGLLRQMGSEGLTLDDLESDSYRFFQFMLSHLDEIKAEGRFEFVQNPQDLEVDWHAERNNHTPRDL